MNDVTLNTSLDAIIDQHFSIRGGDYFRPHERKGVAIPLMDHVYLHKIKQVKNATCSQLGRLISHCYYCSSACVVWRPLENVGKLRVTVKEYISLIGHLCCTIYLIKSFLLYFPIILSGLLCKCIASDTKSFGITIAARSSQSTSAQSKVWLSICLESIRNACRKAIVSAMSM